jgi:hypothetical protein
MAPYKTRILVRRPTDASKFNGTVIIEWLNVSGGVDADPGFLYNWEEIVREGYIHIGVSVQTTGVEGGGFSLGSTGSTPPQALKMWDPARYGSLSLPGDQYSYDIFTQAAEVVRDPANANILGGVKPKRLIAYGESQSAFHLVTYVDAIHPLAKIYNGFFIHSRGAGGTPLTAGGLGISFGGTAAFIRSDTTEPVLQFETETDVFGMIGFAPALQPDTDRLRTWEVAGTSHADKHLLSSSSGGDGQPALSTTDCGMINDGPQHFVLKAALHSLNRWITDQTPPAKSPLLMADASVNAPAKDQFGNSLGGIRTPYVDVPIATLSGLNSSGGGILCSLFGQTTPFTPEMLKSLYPTHQDYVDKVKAAAAMTREAGFMLPPEETTMNTEAGAADVPPN